MKKIILFTTLSLFSVSAFSYMLVSKDKVQQHNLSLNIRGAFGFELNKKVDEQTILSSEKLNNGLYLKQVKPNEPFKGIDNYSLITDKYNKIYVIYGITKHQNLENCKKQFDEVFPLLQEKYHYLKQDKDNTLSYYGGNSSQYLKVSCISKNNKDFIFAIKYETTFPLLDGLLDF